MIKSQKYKKGKFVKFEIKFNFKLEDNIFTI